MIDLLATQPLLLLFIVAAIGWPLGRLSIGGTRLGVATILFAGLAVGALDERLRLPEIVYELGLVLFIYPVALASGPSFFAALRRKGLRDNALVAGVIALAALLLVIVQRSLDLDPYVAVGLFTGALSSTPGLAAVVETLRSVAGPDLTDAIRAQPVVGYSIAYPMGVLGVIGAIMLAARLWKVDYAAEARALEASGAAATGEDLESRTIEVLHDAALERPLAELAAKAGWRVVFTRIEGADGVTVLDASRVASYGAHVTAVGPPAELDEVERVLGRRGERSLELDRSEIDYQRIFVSSPNVAGRTLRSLNLPARFGAVVARVRRGDVDLFPRAAMTLEPGDRVLVVAPRERFDEIGAFFGDSYRSLSEVDITTFALGLFFGLLAGLVPIPLPGGITIQLGLAGGPLLVGLYLGARGFTGRFVWIMPYNANLTVRQIGMVLFLTGVGTQAGYPFAQTLIRPEGLALFGLGTLLTLTTALALLWTGHRLLRIPMTLVTGMLAGLQTQSPVLSFAQDQAGNDLPSTGYATVYPTAMILKIVIAQILLVALV